MKMFVLIGIVAMVLAGSAGANLLINPGFTDDGVMGNLETANITGWTTYGPVGDTWQAWYCDDVEPGDMGVKFWGANCGIYQDWSATPGQTYDLGLDAYSRSSEPLLGSGYLKVEWFDSGNNNLGVQTVASLLTGVNDQWVALSGSALAPANTSYGRIVFGVEGDPCGAGYFDNASVTVAQIPEPGVLSLLGLGLVAVARLHRKNR